MRQAGKFFLLMAVFMGVILLGVLIPTIPQAMAQQPTGSVPTVTGTPEGPFVRVYGNLPVIRVYAGPSSLGDYPPIGILLANETAPALGRAKGKTDWIQIYYAGVPGSVGWVYAPYVSLSSGSDLSILSVPPTPTPFSTPTIDPTLVEAFIGQQTPTRLPTFTPPPPLDQPQFTDAASNNGGSGIPAGLLIFSLALFGFFGVVISYLRGR